MRTILEHFLFWTTHARSMLTITRNFLSKNHIIMKPYFNSKITLHNNIPKHPRLEGIFFRKQYTEQHSSLHNMLQEDAKQVEILRRFSVSPRFQESDDVFDSLKLIPSQILRVNSRSA